MIEIINKQLLLHLVGYLYNWYMGFNSVFKGLMTLADPFSDFHHFYLRRGTCVFYTCVTVEYVPKLDFEISYETRTEARFIFKNLVPTSLKALSLHCNNQTITAVQTISV